jgi:hypothetical protein
MIPVSKKISRDTSKKWNATGNLNLGVIIDTFDSIGGGLAALTRLNIAMKSRVIHIKHDIVAMYHVALLFLQKEELNSSLRRFLSSLLVYQVLSYPET